MYYKIDSVINSNLAIIEVGAGPGMFGRRFINNGGVWCGLTIPTNNKARQFDWQIDGMSTNPTKYARCMQIDYDIYNDNSQLSVVEQCIRTISDQGREIFLLSDIGTDSDFECVGALALCLIRHLANKYNLPYACKVRTKNVELEATEQHRRSYYSNVFSAETYITNYLIKNKYSYLSTSADEAISQHMYRDFLYVKKANYIPLYCGRDGCGKRYDLDECKCGGTNPYMEIDQYITRRSTYSEILSPISFKENAIAHCIGKDARLGKGFALSLKQALPQLIPRSSECEVGDVVMKRESTGTCVFHLVTKHVSSNPPLSSNYLVSSLQKLQKLCYENSIHVLHMPAIGSGLDGLPWKDVKTYIKNILVGNHISVVVHFIEGNKNLMEVNNTRLLNVIESQNQPILDFPRVKLDHHNVKETIWWPYWEKRCEIYSKNPNNLNDSICFPEYPSEKHEQYIYLANKLRNEMDGWDFKEWTQKLTTNRYEIPLIHAFLFDAQIAEQVSIAYIRFNTKKFTKEEYYRIQSSARLMPCNNIDNEPSFIADYDRKKEIGFKMPFRGALHYESGLYPINEITEYNPMWETEVSPSNNSEQLKIEQASRIPTNIRTYLSQLDKTSNMPWQYPVREGDKARVRHTEKFTEAIHLGWCKADCQAKSINALYSTPAQVQKRIEYGYEATEKEQDVGYQITDSEDQEFMKQLSRDENTQYVYSTILKCDNDPQSIVTAMKAHQMMTPRTPVKTIMQNSEYNSGCPISSVNPAALIFSIYNFERIHASRYKIRFKLPEPTVHFNADANPGFPFECLQRNSLNKQWEAYVKATSAHTRRLNAEAYNRGEKKMHSLIGITRVFQKMEPLPQAKLQQTVRSIQNVPSHQMVHHKTFFQSDVNSMRQAALSIPHFVGVTHFYKGACKLAVDKHKIWNKQGDEYVFNEKVKGVYSDMQGFDSLLPASFQATIYAQESYMCKKYMPSFSDVDIALLMAKAENDIYAIRRMPTGEVVQMGPGGQQSGEAATTKDNSDVNQKTTEYVFFVNMHKGEMITPDSISNSIEDFAQFYDDEYRLSVHGDDRAETFIGNNSESILTNNSIENQYTVFREHLGMKLKKSDSGVVQTEQEFLENFKLCSKYFLKLPKGKTPWSEKRDEIIYYMHPTRLLLNATIFRATNLKDRPGDNVCKFFSLFLEMYPVFFMQYESVVKIPEIGNNPAWYKLVPSVFRDFVKHLYTKLTLSDKMHVQTILTNLSISVDVELTEPTTDLKPLFLHDKSSAMTGDVCTAYKINSTDKILHIRSPDGLKSQVMEDYLTWSNERSTGKIANVHSQVIQNISTLRTEGYTKVVTSADKSDDFISNLVLAVPVDHPFKDVYRRDLSKYVSMIGAFATEFSNTEVNSTIERSIVIHGKTCKAEKHTIADVGCGNGMTGMIIRRRIKNLEWVDIEPDKSKYKAIPSSNVYAEFESVHKKGDLEDLFRRKNLTPPCMVIFSYSLGHIDDHEIVTDFPDADKLIFDACPKQPDDYGCLVKSRCLEVKSGDKVYYYEKTGKYDWTKTRPASVEDLKSMIPKASIIKYTEGFIYNRIQQFDYAIHFQQQNINTSDYTQFISRDVLSEQEAIKLAIDDINPVDDGEALSVISNTKRAALQTLSTNLKFPEPRVFDCNFKHVTIPAKFEAEYVKIRDSILTSSYICVQGPPGSGKSTIMSYIIKDYVNSHPDNYVVFLCSFNAILYDFKDKLQNLGMPISGIINGIIYEESGSRILIQTTDSSKRWEGKLQKLTQSGRVMIIIDEMSRVSWGSWALCQTIFQQPWFKRSSHAIIYVGDSRQIDATDFQTPSKTIFDFLLNKYNEIYIETQGRLGRCTSAILTYAFGYPKMKMLQEKEELITMKLFDDTPSNEINMNMVEHFRTNIHAYEGYVVLCNYQQQVSEIQKIITANNVNTTVITVTSSQGMTLNKTLVMLEKNTSFVTNPKQLCVALSRHTQVCEIYINNTLRSNPTVEKVRKVINSRFSTVPQIRDAKFDDVFQHYKLSESSPYPSADRDVPFQSLIQ